MKRMELTLVSKTGVQCRRLCGEDIYYHALNVAKDDDGRRLRDW